MQTVTKIDAGLAIVDVAPSRTIRPLNIGNLVWVGGYRRPITGLTIADDGEWLVRVRGGIGWYASGIYAR